MNLAQKILVTCGCITMLAACKKDRPTADNYISYKLNGVYQKLIPDADSFDDGTFLVSAGPFNQGEIDLFLDTLVQLKTYHFQDIKDNAVGSYTDVSGTNFWSDTGTLVISAYDGHNISGTFAFRARTEGGKPDTLNITEGQFSASISYLSASPDTSECCTPPWPDTCTWHNPTYGVGRNKLINRSIKHARILFDSRRH